MSAKVEDLAVVVVDFGYDQHRLLLPRAALAQIRRGYVITLDGQGYHVEGAVEVDFWTFNRAGPNTLQVVTDEGRDVYQGSLDDPEVLIYK